MMTMSTFIAHDSINLNAQCAEVGGGWGGTEGWGVEWNRKSYKIIITRDRVQSHSHNRCVFRRLQSPAKEAASLIVCSGLGEITQAVV